MSRLSGFTVLLVGLGVGGYLYYPELLQHDASARHAAGRLIGDAEPAPQPVPASSATASTRTFSPQNPLFAAVPTRPAAVAATGSPASQSAVSPVQTVTAAAGSAQQPANGGGERQTNAWAATVKVVPGTESSAPQMVSSRPRGEEARVQLVRDMQTELKRVGCYDGDIDGSWGPGSKRAMSAFTDRVNATLPVEEPDFILLTLLQGHRTTACGKSCPRGQVLSGDRCLPNAVVARAERRQGRTTVAAREPAVGEPATTAGNRAEAAKAEPVIPVPKPVRASRQSENIVAEAAPAPRPRAIEALEGRMSIGGPVPAARSPELRLPEAAVTAEPAVKARVPRHQVAEARAGAPEDNVTGLPPSARAKEPDTGPAAKSETPAKVDLHGKADRHGSPTRSRVTSRMPQHELQAHRLAERRIVRIAPEPRYAPRPSKPVFRSRSQRMVYDLFQRPDRIY